MLILTVRPVYLVMKIITHLKRAQSSSYTQAHINGVRRSIFVLSILNVGAFCLFLVTGLESIRQEDYAWSVDVNEALDMSQWMSSIFAVMIPMASFVLFGLGYRDPRGSTKTSKTDETLQIEVMSGESEVMTSKMSSK